jgi:ABC-type nickel/cobalt efflux system permease component RcnA
VSEEVAMDFEFLYKPVEEVDSWLSALFDRAPLAVALVAALLLGLRHATDPDHLVAVTSLVAADEGGTRRAAHIGAWWGIGHGVTLLAVGLPLILLKSQLPGSLENGAERAVGVVIVLLAVRVLVKWTRGDYRAGSHAKAEPRAGSHRHVRRGPGRHQHVHVRTPGQAVAIGTLHGLAGTGAVVLLLIAALPTKLEAAAALLVFAPMSVASMALCTGAFAWLLTRPALEPVYRTVLIPGFGAFGVLFGTTYVGI